MREATDVINRLKLIVKEKIVTLIIKHIILIDDLR